VRVKSKISSVSWVPSESVTGVARVQFVIGLSSHDEPPPEHAEDVIALVSDDRVRQANELSAWVDFDDTGKPTAWDYGEAADPADESFPTLRNEPVVEANRVRFVQTSGGPLGASVPRRVLGRPFFRVEAPVAWTTLALTIANDGSARGELVGASPFPRHWVYDATGRLQGKSAETDYRRWLEGTHSGRTPWGGEDSAEYVARAESSIERALSGRIMDAEPRVVKVEAGRMLIEQGSSDATIYLVLDGLLDIDVGGQTVAEVGPGAIIGERGSLEGRRSATVRARTNVRVVPIAPESLTTEERAQLSEAHRSEER
jgi:hypothetical protein